MQSVKPPSPINSYRGGPGTSPGINHPWVRPSITAYKRGLSHPPIRQNSFRQAGLAHAIGENGRWCKSEWSSRWSWVRPPMQKFGRIGVDQRRCKFGHTLDLHVAVLKQPFVVLFEQHAPISQVMLPSFGKMPTSSARRSTSCRGVRVVGTRYGVIFGSRRNRLMSRADRSAVLASDDRKAPHGGCASRSLGS